MKEDAAKNRGGNRDAAERPRNEKPGRPDLRTAVIMSELLAPPLAKRKSRR